MAGSAARKQWQNPVVQWIDYRLPIFTAIDQSVGSGYPTPKNLNYFWNFGALAGIVLMLQIVTGVWLAMHYVPHADMAFDSVEYIMRDVNFGWLLRYAHANGASMFFIVLYIHIARGLFYGSYKEPRELVWMLGVLIFLMVMGTAFMGYVLPWGQMSFWGATVITNLFSAIPLVGDTIVTLLWGGFSVDNPTLKRFYSLHYLFPFIISALVVLKVIALHEHGSNNPLGIERKSPKDSIPFHPYYTVKDAFTLGLFFIFFGIFVFYVPNLLGHADNYIPANPMVTPAHIVPEWYFLPFYAMLRSITFDIGLFGFTLISAKLLGVIVMFASILIWFVLPWLDRHPVRSAYFRPWFPWLTWAMVFSFFVLGIVGAMPAEGIWPTIGLICTIHYFAHFLVILPLLSIYEPVKPLPSSISNPVLSDGRDEAGGMVAQPAE